MSAVGDARKRLTNTADTQTPASHALLTHILDLLHDVPDCMTQHQAELFAEWLGEVTG